MSAARSHGAKSAAAPDADADADADVVEDASATSAAGLVEEMLAKASLEAPAPAEPVTRSVPQLGGVRTARLVAVEGRRATVALRGRREVLAEIAPEVDPEIVADALAQGDSVLLEPGEGEGELPLIVGVLQTRRPREIRLKAAIVHIEGDEEVLLRSGRGAVRIRSDGDIEVVGSRISAASRGLFRIVGRMLRLN
jgi:hypothetical protein